MTCSVNSNCLNNQNCFNCAFDEDRFSEYGRDLYNPIDRKIKHPIKQERKDERKIAKNNQRKSEKAIKEQSKSKDRQELLKKATKSEAKVVKTLNSGRSNKDGDMKTSDLTIDAKLQTRSHDWRVDRDEFLKVQSDSARANKRYGVLAITNKNGETVYVIPEELFKEKFI